MSNGLVNDGKESFDISKDVENNNKKVVLNIEEEIEGVVLDEVQTGVFSSLMKGSLGNFNRYLISHSKVKIKEKANFFHLLSVMVNAGSPMIRALRSLENQYEDSNRMKIVTNNLASRIENGAKLSVAMQTEEDVFSEAELGMIESGEVSGQLANVLAGLAKDSEKSYIMSAKVKGAMMYPIIIFLILIAVVTGMMVYVIPQMQELFQQNGESLPLITKIVVNVSDFIRNNGFAIGLILAILGVGFFILRKTIEGRMLIDKVKLKIPIFGDLLKKSYLARFSRSLGSLLDSNVSIIMAMEITANSVGNEVYRRDLMMAKEDMSQGIPLAENLSGKATFPAVMVNMIEVGEQTAQLDNIMKNVANLYEQEVDNAVNSLSKMLEPLILVVIGLTVGVVVAAIMLPIIELTDLAG